MLEYDRSALNLKWGVLELGNEISFWGTVEKEVTVHLAVVGTKMSATPDLYYGRVITGVEIYLTQFITPINFNGRPGRIITGNT